jgi:protein gp37
MNNNIRAIGEKWYEDIKEAGIQDQISFFFVKQLFPNIKPFDADIIMIKKRYDW